MTLDEYKRDIRDKLGGSVVVVSEHREASLVAAREQADEIIKEIRAKIKSMPEDSKDACTHLLNPNSCMLCAITKCDACFAINLCGVLTTITNDMAFGHTTREKCLQVWREATDELEKILKE